MLWFVFGLKKSKVLFFFFFFAFRIIFSEVSLTVQRVSMANVVQALLKPILQVCLVFLTCDNTNALWWKSRLLYFKCQELWSQILGATTILFPENGDFNSSEVCAICPFILSFKKKKMITPEVLKTNFTVGFIDLS